MPKSPSLRAAGPTPLDLLPAMKTKAKPPTYQGTKGDSRKQLRNFGCKEQRIEKTHQLRVNYPMKFEILLYSLLRIRKKSFEERRRAELGR